LPVESLRPTTLLGYNLSNFSIISQASLALSSERIILLAESAHVLPPIGAQGLNTSIHDIKNLYHLVEKRLKNKDEIGNFEFVKEYENLTIEVKAIYDANGNARKWLLYPLLTGFTFGASIFGSMVITHDDPWENILAMIGISITSLALPYYGLKHLDKNQDVEMSPKDIQRYKRIYSEEFNKRKSKNIVKGFGLIGLTAVVGTSFFFRGLSHRGGDIYFGP